MAKHRQTPADREVSQKSWREIERETAFKWAARGVASARRAAASTGAAREAWLLRAAHYSDESREHAALARDGGKTLARVEKMLKGTP